MSARAPRRRFAAPFVLTLAAIPACTVQSGPPPQDPGRSTPTPTNPPRPDPIGPTMPPDEGSGSAAPTGQPGGTNDQVKDTAAVTDPRVAQAEQPTPGPPKPRGYREWTVTRAKGACESMVKVHCPAGAMCNPPPPQKYTCPKFMADGDKIDVLQATEKADCYVDYGDFTCPPAASCNPPRPQKVTCPK